MQSGSIISCNQLYQTFDFVWFHDLISFFMKQRRKEADMWNLRVMVPQYFSLALNLGYSYTNKFNPLLLFSNQIKVDIKKKCVTVDLLWLICQANDSFKKFVDSRYTAKVCLKTFCITQTYLFEPTRNRKQVLLKSMWNFSPYVNLCALKAHSKVWDNFWQLKAS